MRPTINQDDWMDEEKKDLKCPPYQESNEERKIEEMKNFEIRRTSRTQPVKHNRESKKKNSEVEKQIWSSLNQRIRRRECIEKNIHLIPY